MGRSKGGSTKRAFDWRSYSKPMRLLSDDQESAFAEGGILAPLLAWSQSDPLTRFEIRARKAGIYHRGVSLARVSGEPAGLIAEIEVPAGTRAEQLALDTPEAVAGLIDALETRRTSIDFEFTQGALTRNHRSYAAAFARGNAGADLFTDEIVILDSEHAVGKRKLDLVGLLRTEGVTGPGGFASPSLVFVDVRSPERPATGNNGPAAVASDLADFAKALAGEHRNRTGVEMVRLAAQKARLGLAPEDLEVRSVREGMPWLVVAFCEIDPADRACDTAIHQLHDRLAAKHFPIEQRLRFVHITSAPEDGEGLTVGAGDLMTYREFKAYRTANR